MAKLLDSYYSYDGLYSNTYFRYLIRSYYEKIRGLVIKEDDLDFEDKLKSWQIGLRYCNKVNMFTIIRI